MLRYPRPDTPPPDTIAAVDLGSNSFHMIVAKVVDGNFQVVDRLREMVRLGAGLDNDKNLTPEAEKRAIACLKRFGQRLRSLPPGSVRAVGTNTLRQVRNSRGFLLVAETALGHPIEIIAGREEARLVYLGVAHDQAAGTEKNLVVDIGGGSTELIVGQGFQADQMESMHMGCVSMSRLHFSDGSITQNAMLSAELTGALEMRPVKNNFRAAGWEKAIGSSGTIRAIAKVIRTAGWASERDGITSEALERVRNTLIEFGHVDRIELEGLNPERKPVFPGGVAVLSSVFKALNIQLLQVSGQALREGLLSEMLGRTKHEDVREGTVSALCRRYDVDMVQAERVESTARSLYNQVAETWDLVGQEYSDMLAWASRLLEIGLTVSHSQYHKHSAYLVANSDMAGFSRQEQTVLSALIRGHRRKFPLEVFNTLPEDITACVMHLCVLLRLAALLHRSRSATTQVDVRIEVNGNNLQLLFPEGWLDAHTLPRGELEQEARRLKSAGFRLKFQ